MNQKFTLFTLFAFLSIWQSGIASAQSGENTYKQVCAACLADSAEAVLQLLALAELYGRDHGVYLDGARAEYRGGLCRSARPWFRGVLGARRLCRWVVDEQFL